MHIEVTRSLHDCHIRVLHRIARIISRSRIKYITYVCYDLSLFISTDPASDASQKRRIPIPNPPPTHPHAKTLPRRETPLNI